MPTPYRAGSPGARATGGITDPAGGLRAGASSRSGGQGSAGVPGVAHQAGPAADGWSRGEAGEEQRQL